MATGRVIRRSLAPLPEVPISTARASAGMDALLRLLDASPRLCVITGAGLSTPSGIPDYRSPGRVPYTPLQHSAFMSSMHVRRRYWARSLLGYSRMRRPTPAQLRTWGGLGLFHQEHAVPNAGHYALARLQALGVARALVTQNVDGLHSAAGSTSVLELHGSIHEVHCMACGLGEHREVTQERMIGENIDWIRKYVGQAGEGAIRPDGDLNLSDDACAEFSIPTCPACGGAQLKPGVVFHGGTVPALVAIAASDAVASCDAVVAIGTTLTTFSAYRLVRDAAKQGKHVAIVNYGETRGDAHAHVRVSEHSSSVCAALVAHVEARQGAVQMQ